MLYTTYTLKKLKKSKTPSETQGIYIDATFIENGTLVFE